MEAARWLLVGRFMTKLYLHPFLSKRDGNEPELRMTKKGISLKVRNKPTKDGVCGDGEREGGIDCSTCGEEAVLSELFRAHITAP